MTITAFRSSVSTVAGVAILFIGGGVASAQETRSSINSTSGGSSAVITEMQKCEESTTNTNVIDTVSNNPQDAGSGNVTVDSNNNVGVVGSGNMGNTDKNGMNLNISNSGASTCTVANGNGSIGAEDSNGDRNAPGGLATGTAGGSRGGGVSTAAGQATQAAQVTVPAGAVAAGAGGQAYFAAVTALTVASGAWAVLRLRKQLKAAS